MRRRRALRLGAFLALVLTSVIALARAQSTGEPVEIHHIHGLAIDRHRPEILYVATHTGLVRLGPNAAPEWIGTHRYDLMGFTPDPRNSRVFFASGHPDLPAYQQVRVGNLGVIVSSDGGRTWGAVALSGQADFHALTYSARDGGALYGWNVTGPGALYRIAVGQWRAERLPAAGLSRVLSLTASPDPSGTLFAGTEVGLFVSHDAGASWASVSGLSGEAPIPAVRFHVDDGRLLYAYVAGAAMELRRSHDAGTSWEAIPAPVARVVAVAVGPAQHVGLATADSNVIRSADGGRSWQTILARGRPVRR